MSESEISELNHQLNILRGRKLELEMRQGTAAIGDDPISAQLARIEYDIIDCRIIILTAWKDLVNTKEKLT